MNILESWEGNKGIYCAIVRHSRQDQSKYHLRKYEAVWMDEDGELWSFGGTVGLCLADYGTLEEARNFLLRVICQYNKNREVGLETLEV